MLVAVIAASTAVFGWYLTAGRLDLLQHHGLDNFYDIQGRSILEGRLDAPRGSYAFEGFVHNHRTYTYFGLWPSLLRLPVLAITKRYDGRLTTISMLLAFLTVMTATALLYRRIRRLVRRDRPWPRAELLACCGLLFAMGACSNVTFLASRAWVYNEAAIWGLAFTLLALEAVFAMVERRSGWSLVAASTCTALALQSRGSVGVGPVVPLGLEFVLCAFPGSRRLLRWFVPIHRTRRARSPRDRRWVVLLTIALLMPLILFSSVNHAKFGTWATIPLREQVFSRLNRNRQIALRANGGNLFNADLIPTAVIHYFRPDLVSFRSQWPFVAISSRPPVLIGDVRFDTVEPTTGLPTIMPLFTFLAGIGTVGVLRRRRRGRPDLSVLRAPLLGTILAALVTTTIAFLAQRYLTDALPAVILLSLTGWHMLLRRGESGVLGFTQRQQLSTLGVLGALLLIEVLFAWSLIWVYQREVSPPDPAARAAAIRTEDQVARRFGLPRAQLLRATTRLPARKPADALLVVGDCAALWASSDGRWVPVERGRAAGIYHLQVRLRRLPIGGRPVPVLAIGSRADGFVVALGTPPHGSGQLSVLAGRTDQPLTFGYRSFHLLDGRRHDVVVAADPLQQPTQVSVDGSATWIGDAPNPRFGAMALGRNPLDDRTAPRIDGEVAIEPDDLRACKMVAGNR